MHEVFFLSDPAEVQKYAVQEFCPKAKISPDQLRERLMILDASLAAVQGMDYAELRLLVELLVDALSTAAEADVADKWYFDHFKGGNYGFETYEPDEVPTLIASEQRIRDTGNAFDNFNVQILRFPTKYTSAFSGARPKASAVGDWLRRDPEFESPNPASYEERIEMFKQAYIKQTTLRQVRDVVSSSLCGRTSARTDR